MWFDEYVSQHKSEGAKDIFTTCFGRTKGVLSVGDLDASLSSGSVHYTDIQSGLLLHGASERHSHGRELPHFGCCILAD